MEQNEKVESNQYDGRGGFWLLDIPQSESADAQNRRSVRQTPLFSSAGEGAERRVRALQHRFDVGGKSRKAVDAPALIVLLETGKHIEPRAVDLGPR